MFWGAPTTRQRTWFQWDWCKLRTLSNSAKSDLNNVIDLIPSHLPFYRKFYVINLWRHLDSCNSICPAPKDGCIKFTLNTSTQSHYIIFEGVRRPLTLIVQEKQSNCHLHIFTCSFSSPSNKPSNLVSPLTCEKPLKRKKKNKPPKT